MRSFRRVAFACLVSFPPASVATASVTWSPPSSSVWSSASESGRLVFLHIGSEASPLSTAMQEQSFQHAETAESLNARFVCVKIDAEEEPATAEKARALAVHLAQPANLPLNLWLTPQGIPVEVHGYLPPSSEWGRESFTLVALRIAEAWQQDREGTAAAAQATVQSVASPGPAADVPRETLRDLRTGAVATWLSTYSADRRTFGEPPYAIEPELWQSLLGGDDAQRGVALEVLRAVRSSPLRSPLGLYHGRASEPGWQGPSDFVLLRDQLRLLTAFTAASGASDDPSWRHEIAALAAAIEAFKRADGFYVQGLGLTPGNPTPRPFSHARLGDNARVVCSLHDSAAFLKDAELEKRARALASSLHVLHARPSTLLPTGSAATAYDLAWLARALRTTGLDATRPEALLAAHFDPSQGRWLAQPVTASTWWALRIPLPVQPPFLEEAPELAFALATPGSPIGDPASRQWARNTLVRALAEAPTPPGALLLALPLP